jgi:hypothetical protein
MSIYQYLNRQAKMRTDAVATNGAKVTISTPITGEPTTIVKTYTGKEVADEVAAAVAKAKQEMAEAYALDLKAAHDRIAVLELQVKTEHNRSVEYADRLRHVLSGLNDMERLIFKMRNPGLMS